MDGLTSDMIATLVILAGVVVLFVTEVVRVDVAAIAAMVAVGLLGLLPPELLFGGFSSNAVVAIIAIMILGSGLDRTGVIRQLANLLVQLAGRAERRVRAVISGAAAGISALMPNVGVAALFLPVTERVSDQTEIHISRLMMPMGFTAMVGGTLTLVGSTPLILLNDLLEATADNLGIEIELFGLLSPTPVGIALAVSAVLLFALFGRQLLPAIPEEKDVHSAVPDIAHQYGLNEKSHPYSVPKDSPLAGRRIETVEAEHPGVLLVAMYTNEGLIVAPPRDYVVRPNALVALIGSEEEIQGFVEYYGLRPDDGTPFEILRDEERAGVAEVLVRPESSAVGKTVRQKQMRALFGVTLLAVYRNRKLITENLRELRLQAGDVLIVFSPWENLDHLAEETSLVIMADYPSKPPIPEKRWWAIGAFVLAFSLVLFTEFPLPLSLLVGALVMLLSGVLGPSEAYRAVSWRTVFLLGGLIPLGTAVEVTGTAAWVADGIIAASSGLPLWGIQFVVALLTTIFTLTLSNAGATVLLVPLAANIALGLDADPAQFGLIVALAASNSFLLPTHQVNAILMGPGEYEVKDYVRAGSAMTLMFLVVMLVTVNLFV